MSDTKSARWEDIRVSLGPDAEVNGKLSFATPTRIEGRLTGQIKASDVLVVGPHARIEASVEASELIVMGEIQGEVRASGRVEICSGGKVFGDVQTKTLVIREGAVFEGYCRMAQRAVPATDALPTSVPKPLLVEHVQE